MCFVPVNRCGASSHHGCCEHGDKRHVIRLFVKQVKLTDNSPITHTCCVKLTLIKTDSSVFVLRRQLTAEPQRILQKSSPVGRTHTAAAAAVRRVHSVHFRVTQPGTENIHYYIFNISIREFKQRYIMCYMACFHVVYDSIMTTNVC